MPSSLTITAFYSFTPYTKARAIHLNANFSNLRGHMLPIDPTSADATDQTYNLGSTDHRWRTGYFQGVSLSISIGASHILYGTTAGGFKFVKDQTTTFQFLSTYYKGHNATPVGPTTTAAKGQWAYSSIINQTLTNGNLAGSTCTLTHNGRPVAVGLMCSGDTSGTAGIRLYYGATSAVGQPIFCRVIVLEDGNTLGAFHMQVEIDTRSIPSLSSYPTGYWPASSLQKTFIPPSGAGTYNYSIEIAVTSTAGNPSWVAENLRLFAYELP